jgi:hypothetical protein
MDSQIAVETLQPPELPYAEEHFEKFNVIASVIYEIWDLCAEQTAQYLVDAGIHAETIRLKYRKGKYYRRFQTPNGKRGTVSYDLRTKQLTLNGKPVKQ